MNLMLAVLLSVICVPRVVHCSTKILHLSMQNTIKIGLIKEYSYTCSCSKGKINKI